MTIVFILSACAPVRLSNKTWVAIETQDEFSDQITKMVTVGDIAFSDRIITSVGKTYPFIGMINGEMSIGVRSGGKYRLPVGTIQLRIDDNKPWTITVDETPVVTNTPLPTYPGANNEFAIQAMQNATKIMSPFTATTGDKAKSILKEMLNGKILKYRSIGLNQAASTTGVVALDSSLEEALNIIGIKTSDF